MQFIEENICQFFAPKEALQDLYSWDIVNILN